MRIVLGKRHPVLRLATMYDVTCVPSANQLDLHVAEILRLEPGEEGRAEEDVEEDVA